MKIFKYECSAEPGTILMPKGARIIQVDEQQYVPTFWAEVDPDAIPVLRKFKFIVTGDDVPPDHLGYLGTIFITGMISKINLVYHVYEIEP